MRNSFVSRPNANLPPPIRSEINYLCDLCESVLLALCFKLVYCRCAVVLQNGQPVACCGGLQSNDIVAQISLNSTEDFANIARQRVVCVSYSTNIYISNLYGFV